MARPLLDPEVAATVECRLITTGRSSGKAREIRIWFAAVADDRLYVLSQEQERAHWVKNVAADPRVRVRIGTQTFEGRGRVVNDAAEDKAARDAWADKYGTKYFEKFLREALPVAINLEREVA